MTDLLIDEWDRAGELGQTVAWILHRAFEQGLAGRRWSVAELGLGESDYLRLLQVARRLDASLVRSWAGRYWLTHAYGTPPFGPLDLSNQQALCLVLLVLFAEVGRREAVEGQIWPAVRRCVGFAPSVEATLFPTGQPSQALKEGLQEAARVLNLRHVFGIGDIQNWLDSIYLQFGFTIRGAKRRLAQWLVGFGQPLAISTLLGNDGLGSSSFRELWSTLHGYRRGNVPEAVALRVLQDSPWVLSEWAADILEAARKHVAGVPTEAPSEGAEEPDFLSAPQLRWEPPAPPRFTMQLQGLLQLPWAETDYDLRIGPRAVGRFRVYADDRIQFEPFSDGIYSSSTEEQIELDPLLGPETVARILSASGELLADQAVCLWDASEDVAAWDLTGGQPCDCWRQPMRPQHSYGLLVAADLDMLPPPGEIIEAGQSGSHHLVRLSTPWEGLFRVLLDGQELWTPLLKPPEHPPDWSSVGVEVRGPVPGARIRLGQPVRLALTHDSEATVTAVRCNGRSAPCRLLRPGRSELDSLAIAPNSAADHLELRLWMRKGDQVARVRQRVALDVEGVVWALHGQWELGQDLRELSVQDARVGRFRVLPPKDVDGQTIDPNDWCLMEGDWPVRRIRQRAFAIGDLFGHGQPLTLRRGPFNARSEHLTLAQQVVDRGVIGVSPELDCHDDILLLPMSVFDLEPDSEHAVVLWGFDGRLTVTRDICVEKTPEGTFWMADASNVAMPLRAVAIWWRGARQGATWDPVWTQGLDTLDAHANHLAAVVRWLRLPLLGPEYFRAVAEDLAFRAPEVALRDWLGSFEMDVGEGVSLVAPLPEERWLGLVRRIFRKWAPQQGDAERVFATIQDRDAENPLLDACLRLLSAHPLLMHRVLSAYLDDNASALPPPQMRDEVLIPLCCRLAGQQQANGIPRAIEQMEAIAVEEIAASGVRVDPMFVTNGLRDSIRSLRKAEGTPVDWNNVSVALHCPICRRLLALYLYQDEVL